MTKKEAIEKYTTDINSTLDETALKLIRDIYDDFEKRNCCNCKYFVQKTGVDLCKNKELDEALPKPRGNDYWFQVYPTFGCNEWEKKDNEL